MPGPLPAKNLPACTAPLANTALEYAVFGREDENRIMSTVELFLQRGSVVGPKTLEAAFKGRSIYNDGDGNYALVKMILEKLLKSS